MSRAAILILCVIALPVLGQEKPMLITSDTMEYCGLLQSRLAKAGPATPEVRRLTAEGQAMCDHGEVRGGIVRLRRALVLQRQRLQRPHD
jgi:hypothetical protein